MLNKVTSLITVTVCQTALCKRSTPHMKLLATIILSAGMSTGAIRVKHATRRRDLQGARRPQPRFALSLDGTWVLAPETTRGALKDFLVSVGAPRVFAGPLAKAFDADAIELGYAVEGAELSEAAEEKTTTNRTLPLVRRQRQGHRRPRRRRSPIGTSPRRNLRRRAGRPLRRAPPPVACDAQLRQRAEPI